MKKLSVKRISILGVVLVGVSAIAAAMIPSKAKFAAGHIDAAATEEAGADDRTCLNGFQTGQIACNFTAGSDTTDEAVENTSAIDAADINSSQGDARNTGTVS